MNAVPLPSDKGFPRIIACGDSKEHIHHYYIQLENLIFPASLLVFDGSHMYIVLIYFRVFKLHYFFLIPKGATKFQLHANI